MTYGIHKYWVMNNGSVIHDDFAGEGVVESDDYTWPNKSYMVNVDLLPPHLLHADDDTIGVPILKYHHGISLKPDWIVEVKAPCLFPRDGDVELPIFTQKDTEA